MLLSVAPIANDDSFVVELDTPLVMDVLANDTDADGDALGIASFAQGANGSVTDNGDGTLTYSPDPGYVGEDAFTYVITDNADGTDTATVELAVGVDTIGASPNLVAGVLTDVGSDEWTTVTLPGSYTSMVVVATPVHESGDPPVVTRIRNAAGNSFEILVQRLDTGTEPLAGVQVRYAVVEEGVYTQAEHGVTVEAVRFTSTVTDGEGNWVGEQRDYTNSYTSPVVLGQVMTYEDAGQSVFWARGSKGVHPPNATNLFVGKHVGEDPDVTRNDETIGYMVIESGSGTIDGIAYSAVVGPDTVRGGVNGTYEYSLPELPGASSAVLSVAGLDSDEGGAPLLMGTAPVVDGTIHLAFDEDRIGDPEGWHTTDQVAYLALELPNQAPVAVGDAATTDEDTPAVIDVLANDREVDGDALSPFGFDATSVAGGSVSRYETNNVAQFGTAQQSSTSSGGKASRAIDGNTDGVWSHGSVTLTQNEADSWWEVDLGEVVNDLTQVVLFNRVAAPGRLSNFRVSVFNGATEVFGDDFFATGNVASGASFTVELPAGTAGDRVRVQLNGLNNDGNGYLSLAEVQVLIGTYLVTDDVQYDPGTLFDYLATGESATDSFTYTMTDGSLTDTATVEMTIQGVNDTPVPIGDAATTDEDTPVVIDVLANDTDIDGDTLAVDSVTQGANGSVAINADGTLTYSPALDFNGSDSFIYTVTDAQATATATVDVTVNPVADPPPNLAAGVLADVRSDEWTTVTLPSSYSSMVVVATPVHESGDPPVVTRVRNAAGNSFEILVQRLDTSTEPLAGVQVRYAVVEEGNYTEAEHGVTMEAVRFTSTVTDGEGNWVGEQRDYINSYTSPVVLGQVMTYEDAGQSVFWARGSKGVHPPNATNLFVGKHVGEDPDVTRSDETIGYMVIESGSGAIDGIAYSAAVGPDTVRGVVNGTYEYSLPELPGASSAVLGAAGIDGGEGGVPVLMGHGPCRGRHNPLGD